MKFKKLICAVASISVCMSLMASNAFAIDNSSLETSSKPFLSYYFGNDYNINNNNVNVLNSSENKDIGFTMEAADNKADEKPMLYLYLGKSGLYEVNEEQFEEITSEHNLEEVIIRDKLNPMSLQSNQKTAQNYVEKGISLDSKARTKGSWDISNNVPVGIKVIYYLGNNESFVVSKGETLIYTIIPDQNCYLTVGVTGSTVYERDVYIDLNENAGVQLGTDNPGSYKFYVANMDNDFDVYVTGDITIS